MTCVALGEGIFVGPSSGAIFHVALKTVNKIPNGVVAVAPDGGEKYLTTSLCEPDRCLECARRYGIKCSYYDGRPVEKVQVPPSEHISP